MTTSAVDALLERDVDDVVAYAEGVSPAEARDLMESFLLTLEHPDEEEAARIKAAAAVQTLASRARQSPDALGMNPQDGLERLSAVAQGLQSGDLRHTVIVSMTPFVKLCKVATALARVQRLLRTIADSADASPIEQAIASALVREIEDALTAEGAAAVGGRASAVGKTRQGKKRGRKARAGRATRRGGKRLAAKATAKARRTAKKAKKKARKRVGKRGGW